jgi:hypothetical protein
MHVNWSHVISNLYDKHRKKISLCHPNVNNALYRFANASFLV